jgi:hypothetical protein
MICMNRPDVLSGVSKNSGVPFHYQGTPGPHRRLNCLVKRPQLEILDHVPERIIEDQQSLRIPFNI